MSRTPTPRRALTLALAAALVAVAVAMVTVLVDEQWHHFTDSATYLRTAQGLAAGQGYTYQGEPYALRPPGLAFVLSLLVRKPFDPLHAFDLNLLIQASAVAMLLSTYLLLRRLHGTVCALALTLLLAVNPITVGSFNGIFSELPHLALFFTGLWLLLPAKDDDRQPHRGRQCLGTLFLGASLWFRLVGLIVLPCLVLCRRGCRRPRLRTSLWQAAWVLALIAPWLLQVRTREAQAPRPTTQRVAFNHSTAMFHVDGRDPDSALLGPDEWAERIVHNLSDITATIDHAFLGGASFWARVRESDRRVSRRPKTHPLAVLLTAALGACLLFALFCRRSLLDGYCLLYALIVLLWFTYVQRMLLPLLPPLLSAVAYTLERAASRWLAPRQRLTALIVLAALVVTGPLRGSFSALTAGIEVQDGHRRQLQQAERNTARWLAGHTEPEATVLHTRAPVIGLLADRTTYTWRNLPGTWPDKCPPVDWAVYGPEDVYPEVHRAIAERGELVERLPAGRRKRPGTILIYRMAH